MLSPLQKHCPKTCLQALGTKGCSEIKTPDCRVGNKTRLPMRLSEGHFKTVSSLRINALILHRHRAVPTCGTIPAAIVQVLRTTPYPAAIVWSLRTGPLLAFGPLPSGSALFPAVIARLLRTAPFLIFGPSPPGAALFLIFRNDSLDCLLDGRGDAEQRTLRHHGTHGLAARLCEEHFLDALPALFVISIAHEKRVAHKAMRANRLRYEMPRVIPAFPPKNPPCIARNHPSLSYRFETRSSYPSPSNLIQWRH